MIYISLLEDNVFDMLLEAHPLLKKPGIKEKVKKATNCIPHKLMYLIGYVNKLNASIIDINFFQQILNEFEDKIGRAHV